MKRRAFLTIIGASAGGYLLRAYAGPLRATAGITRGGAVDIASGQTTLTGPYTVAAGKTFRFDPNIDTTVKIDANFIVKGILEMRPNPGVRHTLRFVKINEAKFVGGGLRPIATDVGLWVMGAGRLDIVGDPRAGWSTSGQHPSWRSGDELLLTPHVVGDWQSFVPYTGGPVPAEAEVLNLTRTVNIEGTPGHRSHIFIRSSSPQKIRYVGIRHMGPRKNKTVVQGRWSLHFHHSGEGSRGSMVEGVVVRDAGSHGFVPHGSHGITFYDCIAYDLLGTGYWWDPRLTPGELAAPTHDTVWDRCVAAKIRHETGSGEGYRWSGFRLGNGDRNSCRNCVATGVVGSIQTSGFDWPEIKSSPTQKGFWEFTGNRSHNNLMFGIFNWQNNNASYTQGLHEIRRFESFADRLGAVFHGAYINDATYEDLTITSPDPYGIALSALPFRFMTFRRVVIDGRGHTVNGVSSRSHRLSRPARVLFEEVQFNGLISHPVSYREVHNPSHFDFVHCTVDAGELEPQHFDMFGALPGTDARVQRANGTAYRIDHTGTVTTIPSFA